MTNFERPTPEQMQIYNDDSFIHLTSPLVPRRPGVALFYTMLEYNFFPPKTERNKDYKLLTVRWADTIWFLVSIPSANFLDATSTAQFCGLELFRKTPVMTKIGEACAIAFATDEEMGKINLMTFDPFPIQSKTLYVLDPVRTGQLFDINDPEWLVKEDKMVLEILGEDLEANPPSKEELEKLIKFLAGEKI